MPGKGQSDNFQVLGSIFDFLFKEAKKPPDRRRPIEKTGLSGSDAFTDAIVTSLANPGVFVSDTVLGEMNDSLDVGMASFQFDETGKVNISSTNLIDFIKDPATMVQKSIDRNKMIRQSSRAKFLGDAMNDFINTSWAYRYGNLEVKKAMATTAVANQKRESYKISEAMGQYAKGRLSGSRYAPSFDIMAERSLDLLGKKTFGESTWNSMGADAKTEFTQIVSGGAEAQNSIGRTMFGTTWDSMSTEDRRKHTKNSQRNISAYLASRYSSREANNFKDLTDRVTKGKLDSKINIFDPDVYKTLEKDNILTRIKDIGTVPIDSKEAQEKRMYRKALLLLNSDAQSEKSMVRTIDHLKKEISKTTDKDKKNELKKQLKDSKSALRVISLQGPLAKLGQYEGYLNSLKNVWGPGGTNVAASILTGDFFDANKNTVLNPVSVANIAGRDIIVAKKEKNSANKDRVFKNAYNRMGEKIYYVTPRSIFKTILYNGEGFMRGMQSRVDAFSALTDGVTELKDIRSDFVKGITAENINVKDLDKFIEDTLNKIKATNKLTAEQLEEVERLLKGSARLRKLTERFSVLSKVQNKMTKVYQRVLGDRLDKGMKMLRVKFARALLKNKAFRNLLVKTGANKLIGQWVASGGIRVLIKSLVTAVAGAVGLVGTPLASFVVSAVTWIATDVLMKMFKETMVIMKYVFMGILAIITLVVILPGLAAVGKYNKKTFSYTNAIPDSVVECWGYSVDPIQGSDESFIDPDYETQCVGGETIQGIYERVVSMMGLRTQLELISCPGHDMCPRIDWAWCYSADKIYCRADRLAGASCPTLERLFIHELVHQIQGANAGRIYGTKLREWGADYLSSNGGGYRFMTPEGCVRATQVPFPSSCNPALLAAIARSEGWAYESDCRRYLDNYISRFCTSED